MINSLMLFSLLKKIQTESLAKPREFGTWLNLNRMSLKGYMFHKGRVYLCYKGPLEVAVIISYALAIPLVTFQIGVNPKLPDEFDVLALRMNDSIKGHSTLDIIAHSGPANDVLTICLNL